MKQDKLNNSAAITKGAIIIKDIFGLAWKVKQARPTKYGFEIYYGRRVEPYLASAYGLIYTNELKTFWDNCALTLDGTIFDLPAGRTTLKRARTALGFNWHADSDNFWNSRKEDMKNLSPQQFAKKYECLGISGRRMSVWRFKILGSKARPLGWWEEPETIKLLLSGKSLSKIRAELTERISTTQASRIRTKARRAYQLVNGEIVARSEEPLNEAAPSPATVIPIDQGVRVKPSEIGFEFSPADIEKQVA